MGDSRTTSRRKFEIGEVSDGVPVPPVSCCAPLSEREPRRAALWGWHPTCRRPEPPYPHYPGPQVHGCVCTHMCTHLQQTGAQTPLVLRHKGCPVTGERRHSLWVWGAPEPGTRPETVPISGIRCLAGAEMGFMQGTPPSQASETP